MKAYGAEALWHFYYLCFSVQLILDYNDDSQCENFRNLLSRIFLQNYVKWIFSISLYLELVSRNIVFAKEKFDFLHTVWQKVVISFFTNCVSCNDFSCLLRKAVAKGQMCEDWFPVIENLDLKSATLGPSINQNVVNQNCFLKVKLKRS